MNGPNGIRWDRIAAGFAVAALIVSLFVSYIQTTNRISASLDRNCRLLVRVESEQQFLIFQGLKDRRAAEDFRNSVAQLPNEVCD